MVKIAPVAVATIIPWLVVVAILNAVSLDQPLRWVLHSILVLGLFAVSFWFYYKKYSGVHVFTVMITAMTCYVGVELFYLTTVGTLPWEYNYLCWILPAFVTASTIYGMGNFVR